LIISEYFGCDAECAFAFELAAADFFLAGADEPCLPDGVPADAVELTGADVPSVIFDDF
jgi:hypothetical protein